MVERARRLRVGFANSPPGASGDTARPNYVGPSGDGLMKRMKAGESPPNQGRSVCRPPLSVFIRRSRGLRKNAAVERREVNAHRTGRAPQGVSKLPAPFGAPLPSHLVRELSPHERGDGNARRSPRLARTGAAELWLLHSPAVGDVNR